MTIVRLAPLALALALPLTAVAQATRPPRAGIAVGVSGEDVAAVFTPSQRTAAQLYFPVYVTPSLRLEPQLGILTITDEALGTEETAYTVGAGLLFVRRVAPQVLGYLGPRVALSFVDQDFDVGGRTVNATGTNVRVAGVVGGEYEFAPRFTLGAEGQLGYLSVGEQRRSDVGDIPGGSSWQTAAVLFVRVYLL
jgi:hypothetical protein